MDERQVAILDGNEAAASVAYRTNEICGIYPITPSSTMGELADQWASEGKTNIWGTIPMVAEMQSEGGAAGAVHGALQTGALTTTFTASQGLMLMIPNMYKIAGELTATVFHVAARSLACQGLSIFGDHSDVMAVRSTGFAFLASSSVQEAHDLALIAQAATLETRIPFIHFFDGFRTSHELNRLTLLSDDDIRFMIREELVLAHRGRALNPSNPFIRGTAQNPDVYFQARETVNPYYARTPQIVQNTMDEFARLTGRRYQLFDYYGDSNAERILILMGSGAETAKESVDYLSKKGEKVGLIQVHLYRPFSTQHLLAAMPATVKAIAVLDRTKEPGATGEPLYVDIMTSLGEALTSGGLAMPQFPKVIGGRYGLSSKEFTPAMVKTIFVELSKERPKNHFTIGINDDVTHSSLVHDLEFNIEPSDVYRAVFYGLGADGTVGANKNTIKIVGEEPNTYAQGYFVYDSKKSGSQTISHLRFGSRPIRSSYLIQSANFIGCHQPSFLYTTDILAQAAPGATLLLNSTVDPKRIWDDFPRCAQRHVHEKSLSLYVIDAYGVARESGMGRRINAVMQTCFFAIAGVLSKQDAIARIKNSIRKTYGRKGDDIVQRNFKAVDNALAHLYKVEIPAQLTSGRELAAVVPAQAPQFIQQVTAMMMAGRGDELPVSRLPADGTYPSGTTAWEKRNVSAYVPVWEPDICIQCGNCGFVCPHSVIRAKLCDASYLDHAPVPFKSAPIDARGFPDTVYTLQVYLEDCTGCGLCVSACPARSKQHTGTKAINMRPKAPLLEQERISIRFFESLPYTKRERVDFSTVRGVQFLQPLFEFPGSCAGCGETPYVKLLSQLFGDRLTVANATGCSSIYGGNLPTTPWTKNNEGRGPAWSNSLFEDNAEFGFGFRLTADKHLALAREYLQAMAAEIGERLVDEILQAAQKTEAEIRRQRARVAALKELLKGMDTDKAKHLYSISDHLVRGSIWIVGGDGWAYDIGSSGLDHVLSSGRDVNVLVLDTEVYSNTGGQMSKSTPMGAVAKFAASGKKVPKKDLALQAIAYGDVYVARVAMGANPQQTLLAFREAETYPGPALILAYSHCIAHGINMQFGLKQQRAVVECGHWPLMRYNPELRKSDTNPFVLDSQRPKTSFKSYAYSELRYKMLMHTNPRESEHLIELAQQEIDRKWKVYERASYQGPRGS